MDTEQNLQSDDQQALLYRTPSFRSPVSAQETIARPSSTGFDLPAIDGYEVLEVINHGGMGVVYRARQLKLNRLVALKMLLPSVQTHPEDLARFRLEAEAIARLQHPHIVQIYEVGEHQGRPYFSLELMEGGSLAQKLRGQPLPPRPAARLVETLARAIAFAHQQGIVHRDLKPANVLLVRRDGTSSVELEGGAGAVGSYEPKISDFGLAKLMAEETGLLVRDHHTRTGAILGTPSYMAPEQAAGHIAQIGPATDVYALGAILYELLTGRPPFRADTILNTLQQVLMLDPVPPRSLQPKVPRDLETVCLKCLEKEPKKRYASAEELANDLRRHHDGEPIRARNSGLFERLWSALDRSQHDVEFLAWGNILLGFAPLVFLAHLLVFVLVYHNSSYLYAAWAVPVSVIISCVSLPLWLSRPHLLMPNTPAGRQFWSIIIGHLIASLVLLVVSVCTSWSGQPRDWLAPYPALSILMGMTFYSLGSNYWGRFYLVGAAFFVLALLMPINLLWAPVGFGVVAAATLAITGVHLRRLAKHGNGS